jgi:hypothetical protein
MYVVYCYTVRSFFLKNPGNTGAEICEKQQGKRSAKSSFLTCCQGGLIYSEKYYFFSFRAHKLIFLATSKF